MLVKLSRDMKKKDIEDITSMVPMIYGFTKNNHIDSFLELDKDVFKKLEYVYKKLYVEIAPWGITLMLEGDLNKPNVYLLTNKFFER